MTYGHVEKVWAVKWSKREDRDIEVQGWAVVMTSETGAETDQNARLYENTFARKRDAAAELARRLDQADDPLEREDEERRAYPWPPVRGEDY